MTAVSGRVAKWPYDRGHDDRAPKDDARSGRSHPRRGAAARRARRRRLPDRVLLRYGGGGAGRGAAVGVLLPPPVRGRVVSAISVRRSSTTRGRSRSATPSSSRSEAAATPPRRSRHSWRKYTKRRRPVRSRRARRSTAPRAHASWRRRASRCCARPTTSTRWKHAARQGVGAGAADAAYATSGLTEEPGRPAACRAPWRVHSLGAAVLRRAARERSGEAGERQRAEQQAKVAERDIGVATD